jgi:2-phosphoglycerate kinase
MSPSLPRVILIGGVPMSGKSTVARVLADRHRRSVIATDDLGAAVRAVTKPGSPPMQGEDYREYYVARTVERLWQEALDSHRALQPAIEAVARMHATASKRSSRRGNERAVSCARHFSVENSDRVAERFVDGCERA